MGLRPEAERGPRRAGHARQRRGETGEEVRRQVRGRKAPSWGGGDHVPELVPDSPSAGPRVRPGSSPEPVPDRPLEPVPDPHPVPVPDPPRAGPCSGAPRAAQDKSLSSQLGYTRLYRLGGAPISGDARDRAPGPALRSALLPAAVPEPWPWPRRGAPARSQSLDWSGRAGVRQSEPPSLHSPPANTRLTTRPPLALAHTRSARARCRLGILSKFPARACFPTLRSLRSCQSSSKAWVYFRKCPRTRPPSPPNRPTNGFNLPYNHWSNDLQALQVACAPDWVTCWLLLWLTPTSH